jgi:hypothetical protein
MEMERKLRIRREIFVECFVIFQITAGDPLIVFRAVTNPLNKVFDIQLADFLVVDDLVDKVFGVLVVIDQARFLQGARRPFRIVILFEGLDVRCVKGGECQGNCNSGGPLTERYGRLRNASRRS